MNKNNEIALVDEKFLENKIYIIRGQKVMLDKDLAMIYGYYTKRFNEQVKNNIVKFDKDFMFQLTEEEVKSLSRHKFCASMLRPQNVTMNDEYTNSSRYKNSYLRNDSNLCSSRSKKSTSISRSENLTSIMQGKGMKGGRVYRPYVFTEKGVYMLMTVLKGPLATKQSIALIRLFDSMKNYIIDNSQLLTHNEALRLSLKNKEEIDSIKDTMATKDDINTIKKELNIINTEFIEEDNINSMFINI